MSTPPRDRPGADHDHGHESTEHSHGSAHDDDQHSHGSAHDDDQHSHGSAHDNDTSHGHTHGQLATDDPDGLRVVMLSSVVLAGVAAVELTAAVASGSAGVLADGLHNLGDVSTTLALASAFILSRRAPSQRFPYGYHRGEDLAGLVVFLLMLASVVAAGYTSIDHLLHRRDLSNLTLAFVVALVGLVGNEVVAQYKTRAGRRLNSMALVADGRHSRIDGVASLGAAVGVAGAWLGFPLLDPLAGLVITLVIAAVAWDTARNVTSRLLDEADASLAATATRVASATAGVVAVTATRTRWTGRRIRVEMTLEVDGSLTVATAHGIGEAVRHRLYHEVPALGDVIVHLDPAGDASAHAEVAHHA